MGKVASICAGALCGLAVLLGVRHYASPWRAVVSAERAVLVSDLCPHSMDVAVVLSAREDLGVPVVGVFDDAPCRLSTLPGGMHRLLPRRLACDWLAADARAFVEAETSWWPVWLDHGEPVPALDNVAIVAELVH